MILPNIDQLLKYTHPWIIERYKKDYSNNQLPAEEALKELLKYFWICQKHKVDKMNNPDDEILNFDCAMHPEMREIDDMWHTFLLFTRENTDFCNKYFSRFIHHIPRINEEEIDFEDFKIRFSHYLSYVYDHLGSRTLQIWFADYV
jgi:hypothetical protein